VDTKSFENGTQLTSLLTLGVHLPEDILHGSLLYSSSSYHKANHDVKSLHLPSTVTLSLTPSPHHHFAGSHPQKAGYVSGKAT
jgi:hypothetical protein